MLLPYLVVASGYFSFLVTKIVQDSESSLKDSIHLKVAGIAALIWPVAIPLSLLELKAKREREQREAVFNALPRPATMADGEIRYIKQVNLAAEDDAMDTEVLRQTAG